MAAKQPQQSNTAQTTSPMSITSTKSSISDVSLESMHGYGDSWFESMNDLVTQYHQQKAEQAARPAQHNYGDSWFENLNHQREDFEHRKSEELERESHRPHNYGDSWFETLNHQREDFEHQKEEQQGRSQQPHNHGSTWFEHFEGDWKQWKQVHEGKSS